MRPSMVRRATSNLSAIIVTVGSTSVEIPLNERERIANRRALQGLLSEVMIAYKCANGAGAGFGYEHGPPSAPRPSAPPRAVAPVMAPSEQEPAAATRPSVDDDWDRLWCAHAEASGPPWVMLLG